ncbi:MAG: RNA polymerase sigma factor [Oscillospiraceae bacterium]
MEDHEIVALYWRRDERAIEESGRKYGPYCYSLAQRILQRHEDAEECVSDTWLRAWNAMPPQRPNRLRLFLARITRNLAFDRCRALGAEKRGGSLTVALEELGECLAAPEGVEEPLRQKELEECLGRFLRSLPARERGVFLRRYFFLDSTGEIAARYGLSDANVLTLLSRTRKKLKAQLGKEGFDT